MNKKLPGLRRTRRPGTETEPEQTPATKTATSRKATSRTAAKAAKPKRSARTATVGSAGAATRASSPKVTKAETESSPPPPVDEIKVEVPEKAVEIVDPAEMGSAEMGSAKMGSAKMARAETTPVGHTERAARRHREARQIVSRYAVWSSAGGLMPIPYANVLLITGTQISMVADLARLYGVPYSREVVKSVLGAVVGGALPWAISAGTVGLLFKSIPGVGLAVGLATMAGLSNLSTRTLGRLFISHFEAGGNLDTVDTDGMSRDYARTAGKTNPAAQADAGERASAA